MSSYDINYFYCDDKEISSTAKIGLLVFYPLIMFIGLVGNLLIILIVFTHKELRKTTNWFIVKHGGFRLYVLINIHFSRLGGDGGELLARQ